MKFLLNNQMIETDQIPGSVLLDFIRRDQRLTGTKEVCREGDCGACSVLVGELKDGQVDYKVICSCLFPLGEAEGRHVVTIEGLNPEKGMNPVQQAILDEGATQCGFCTPGIVVALTGFLLTAKTIDEENAVLAIAGNICRCTGYVSIRRAALNLQKEFAPKLQAATDRVRALVELKVLPEYFLSVAKRLNRSYKSYTTYKTYIAGGTDLYVQRADQLKNEAIAFASQNPELSRIWQDDTHIYFGGGVTTEALKQSRVVHEFLPSLEKDLVRVSSLQIRNRATIAGNIVNASPIGDLSIIFLALGAELGIQKDSQTRTVALKNFYKGYKQFDLQKGEIIVWIRVPKLSATSLFHFEKVSKRTYLDIASVNSAISLECDGPRIINMRLSAGGVAPFPLFLSKTCEAARGQDVSKKLVENLLGVIDTEIAPISDIRGSAEYKRLLLKQLVRGHFNEVFTEKL